MESESDQRRSISLEPSTSINPQLQEEEEEQRRHQAAGLTWLVSTVGPNELRNDVCYCLIVLLTFWLLVSVTVIMGFYGSENLSLGPNCSRLVQVNSLFVQSIKAEERDESNRGAVLYGFYEPPPLDVEIAWSETHDAFIQPSYHKEWKYFLNKGSQIYISYSVKPPSSAPLFLAIARGRENIVEWIEDPSSSNTTLSWNLIDGNGIVQQDISTSNLYYIALGSLNSEEVEVQLNVTIKAFVYNTTQAYQKCLISSHFCNLKLFIASENAAVLTSPGPEQDKPYDDWYIKLSYSPRWITYFFALGATTFLIILAFRVCKMLRMIRRARALVQAGEVGSEQTPLLPPKDDLSSCGSSYGSISFDEEEPDECVATAPADLKDGENNCDLRRFCVICFDAQRDCFFLPCGHCVACFACGTRVIEETGTCPICRRKTKKIRKIFTV